MCLGDSIREQQRLPLRWFAEEVPPAVVQEDEIQALAPYLAEALQHVGPAERAHFEVRGPGNNPRYSRNVVGGWVAFVIPICISMSIISITRFPSENRTTTITTIR